VLTSAGGPLAGASIEIARAPAPVRAPSAASRFAWALGAPLPEGDVLGTTVTDATGAFEALHLPATAVHVLARHASACTAASPRITLPSENAVELRLAARPVLTGRVLGIPAGRAADVLVTVGGGASQLRSVPVAADATYAFEGLEPGEYVVRAGLGAVEALEANFVHSVFAPAAGPPERQVVLRAGERRVFDVVLQVPPAGSIRGSVRLNGQPAPACRVTLLVPDAPRPLTAAADPFGEFTLRDAPIGEFELRVQVRAGGMQEVHRERVRITADATTTVLVDAATGGLSGRVSARDGTPDNQLAGDVLLLPGCSEMPADLAAYRREHRAHQLTVRDGVFRGDVLTAGRALAVVRIRNREPSAQVVDVPVSATGNAELVCGPTR
jgi:hypothetical protein